MKRVLLTGANGFVGRHCIPGLLNLGYEVHGVSRQANLQSDIIWHHVDLLDSAAVNDLVKTVKPTHLLHAAWDVRPGYWDSTENFQWVSASLVLLQAFVANGGQRSCLVGTCAEYDWSTGLCIENQTPLVPTTPYGICKHALQMMAASFAQQVDLSCAWARLFYLYGNYEYPTRLVPSVIRSLLQNQPIPCTHGEFIRDVLHVTDVANALVALIESDVTGNVNIASGMPIALKEIILMIGTQLNKVSLIQLGALTTSPHEPPSITADIQRLRNEVKWMPETTLAAGIARAIAWWQELI